MSLLTTTSGHGLSIGTDHALQTLIPPSGPLYDEERVIPEAPTPLRDYSTIYINVKTLHRNLLSAIVDKDISYAYLKKEIGDALEREIHAIVDIIRDAQPDISIIFYYFRNKHIEKIVKEDKDEIFIRRLRETQLKEGTNIYNILSSWLDVRSSIDKYTTIYKTSGSLFRKQGKSIALTHIPLDLLPKYQGKATYALDLLESHTGLVKPYDKWWSKYYKIPKEDSMDVLPFNGTLLQILGDGPTFKPYPIKTRRWLMTKAITNHWNAATSERQVIRQLSNFYQAHHIMVKEL